MLHTWFYDNRREEAKFRSVDNGKAMNVAMAVDRRARREKAKALSVADFFGPSVDAEKLKVLASKLDSTYATQSGLSAINASVTKLFDAFFNLKSSTSLAVGTIPYAILRSYFRERPKFEMIKIPNRNFRLQATEITQRDWFVVMGTNPVFFPTARTAWQSTKHCRESKFARAGSVARFSYGDSADAMADFGWSHQNSKLHTHPVRSKKANRWGLFDMHGNVWEIVHDDRKYPRDEERRITIRGGSWIDAVPDLAIKNEARIFESWTCYDVGFRLAQ